MHAMIKTVSELVYGGDIDRAERALVTVADEEGDQALALLIDEMPARDVVAILREHDSSKVSVISELISPQQFLAAISLERAYKDRRHDALKGMINSVVFTHESKSDEFIDALGSSEAGLEALVDYFSDRHEEVEHFFRHGSFGLLEEDELERIIQSTADLDEGELNDTQSVTIERLSEIQDGDWRELAWRLRCEHWDIFRVVLELLRGRMRAALRAPAVEPPKRGMLPAQRDDEDDVL